MEWLRFVAWEKANPLPRVFAMPEPLLPAEFIRLLGKYSKREVIDVLEAMENHPQLYQKGNSANRTAQSWIALRRRKEAERTLTHA